MALKQLHVQQIHDITFQGAGKQNEMHFKYRVIRVVNATSPNINDVLTKAQTDAYCEQDDWKVTIT